MTLTQTQSSVRGAPYQQAKADSYRMFNRIARRYDLLNHLLSAGQDILWRRKAVRHLKQEEGQSVLDLACGTSDFILTAMRLRPGVVRGVGVDLAGDMLSVARRKLAAREMNGAVQLVRGDGMRIPLASESMHSAMIAFGIRNMPDVDQCLAELRRVLRPGGRLIVLEFSLPASWLVRSGYLFYFRHVLPVVGGVISGHWQAYRYLNRTVEAFQYGDVFRGTLFRAGFSSVELYPLSFGISTIYVADR